MNEIKYYNRKYFRKILQSPVAELQYIDSKILRTLSAESQISNNKKIIIGDEYYLCDLVFYHLIRFINEEVSKI
jgi:hypothetical protein